MGHDEYAPADPTEWKRNNSTFFKLGDWVYNFFDRPVTWFREKIVEPNRQEYPWYHMKLKRVPTIDQCFTDDVACFYEADQQYKRDRAVDSEIINILRYRMDDCQREEAPDWEKCKEMKEAYEQASEDWFCKYGDLGAQHTVLSAYMKQKHRLIWERRHGKVGTGMKKNQYSAIEPEIQQPPIQGPGIFYKTV